ncbi:MAG: alpha/beta hydrolase [Proteobacteria bacterium]|nr:alpha/beta hydrolase [Pseudomonadota bacterium]
MLIQGKNRSAPLVIGPPDAKWNLLFAAGGGGNPENYSDLLRSFVDTGFRVVAPYFDRMGSEIPKVEELVFRSDRLCTSMNLFEDSSIPILGVGHSIGASLLLSIAGGKMGTQSGEFVPIRGDARLGKLVLFAPPTDFFQAPGALSRVHSKAQVWYGNRDLVTSPVQAEVLRRGMPTGTVDLRVVEGIGHFSFMSTLPPGVEDPLENREGFLKTISEEVYRFLVR